MKINNPSVFRYWTLNEVTGTRVDSTVGATLTEFPGIPVGSAPGMFALGVSMGSGAFQEAVGDTGLSSADKAQTGNGFSICGWLNISALNVSFGEISYISLPPVVFNPQLEYFFSSGFGFFRVHDDNNTDTVALGVPPIGVWRFLHMFYDATAHQMGISFNLGAPTFAAIVASCAAGTAGQCSLWQSGAVNPCHWVFDELLLKLDGCLTAAQLAYLYNGGSGRTWPISLP